MTYLDQFEGQNSLTRGRVRTEKASIRLISRQMFNIIVILCSSNRGHRQPLKTVCFILLGKASKKKKWKFNSWNQKKNTNDKKNIFLYFWSEGCQPYNVVCL